MPTPGPARPSWSARCPVTGDGAGAGVPRVPGRTGIKTRRPAPPGGPSGYAEGQGRRRDRSRRRLWSRPVAPDPPIARGVGGRSPGAGRPRARGCGRQNGGGDGRSAGKPASRCGLRRPQRAAPSCVDRAAPQPCQLQRSRSAECGGVLGHVRSPDRGHPGVPDFPEKELKKCLSRSGPRHPDTITFVDCRACANVTVRAPGHPA